MSKEKRLIENLDAAWQGYVHNQNAEITKLLRVKRRARELLAAMERGENSNMSREKLVAAMGVHDRYAAWRKKHDQR